MTYTKSSFAIEGIAEPTITDYFVTFNQEAFNQTASLFAEAGELLAPFEQPIVSRAKIADYLTREAKGMQVLPKWGMLESESEERYKVLGKVKTSLFSVNVAWYFTLNAEREIVIAHIKLLASPQELLGLKSKREK